LPLEVIERREARVVRGVADGTEDHPRVARVAAAHPVIERRLIGEVEAGGGDDGDARLIERLAHRRARHRIDAPPRIRLQEEPQAKGELR
jgi:hypothetical protein